MNASILRQAFAAISRIMDENRIYLIELDQQNGDGDLGISMSVGYRAAVEALDNANETDLGKLLVKAGFALNEAAPSTLGTITTIAIMGMAKELMGKEEVSFATFSKVLMVGVNNIMTKTGSKPGEKTIIDALFPAVEAMQKNTDNPKTALQAAYKAAAEGSESTRNMLPVHGRAAYYGEKVLGILDGGSVVGKLIFEALYNCFF